MAVNNTLGGIPEQGNMIVKVTVVNTSGNTQLSNTLRLGRNPTLLYNRKITKDDIY